MKVQVQGAKLTTSHWTHVTEGCNAASHYNHHHWMSMSTVECTMEEYITSHVVFTSPYKVTLIVASCITIVLMLVLIWSIVAVVVIVCCCCIPLQLALMLVQMFAPCTGCFYQLVQIYTRSLSTCANTA